MKIRVVRAVFAATALVCQFTAAQATCVISPDHKSISVVTDNGASDEKTCSVSCKVDTKVGVLQVSCGGTTPPLAKGHALCGFDKPDAFYNKVVSAQDSCKGEAAEAPAVAAPIAAASPKEGFSCRISPDGKTVDAMIANPYKGETSCQMDCRMSTTNAGTTMSVSCTGQVSPGIGQVVLCSHAVDNGRAVKMVSGHGECIRPLAERTDAEKALDKKAADDEAAEVDRLMHQPMPAPSAANKADEEELEKIGNDPVKLQEYMDKKMNDAMQNATKQMKP
jgi:hypothetical protein